MILGNFSDCEDLHQFYQDIRMLHEKEHGREYAKNHDLINEVVQGKIYKELGVMQGASLAGAILSGAKEAIAIDIDLSRILPYKRVFEKYSHEHLVKIYFIENDSTDINLSGGFCDVLHIDSKHTKNHCLKELAVHAPLVSEYIIFHDTNVKGINDAVLEFLDKEAWVLDVHIKENVGAMRIKRKC